MPLLTIKHNIREVRERLQRFGKRVEAIPAEMKTDRPWLADAKEQAEDALFPISGSYYWLVPRFVETVAVELFGSAGGDSGMIWTMKTVKDLAIKASELPPEVVEDLWARKGEIVSRDLVEDWVAQFKDKTILDIGDSDADIARRLLAIIFGGDAIQQAAGKAILFGREGKHKDYLIELLITNVEQLLSTEQINAWMTAVLIKWRSFILATLPPMIRMKIKVAWAESKSA